MNIKSRIWVGVKALRELGLEQVGLNAFYRFGLRTGHYQRQLNAALTRLHDLNRRTNLELHPCFPTLPERYSLRDVLGDQINELYEEADEIVSGRVRLFGGAPVPLVLNLNEPLEEWVVYEGGMDRRDDQDIKFIWEPGRFGWACTLARAYYLSGNERYAAAFWEHTERFLSSNPPYLGPHWSSAQEVAIRLIALAFALQVFARSSHTTPDKLENIARAITFHAERIPPTVVYARSLNNNHLIMEALGLYTASVLLQDHPLAHSWHRLGWKWLQYAFPAQISPDGTYTQHSTNYHRLMLQAALWMYALHEHAFPSERIPPIIQSRLEASTKWLWQLLDPESGKVPNLGHNDGAYILPLSVCAYPDFRPVIYSAAQTFLHTKLAPDGPWCEMMYWLCPPTQPSLVTLGVKPGNDEGGTIQIDSSQMCCPRNPLNNSWAMFRVASFRARPAHADQLHVDLWWRGLNLAQDSGTYLYNGLPPWDNSLTSAFVHNTVTVDGQEFMLRVSRFLYLDWAHAKVIAQGSVASDEISSITAEHNGYRKMGLVHSRKVTTFRDGHWEIIDRITGSHNQPHAIRLHWLLPDWEYELHEAPENDPFSSIELRIRSPYGWVALKMGHSLSEAKNQTSSGVNFQLVRAGSLLFGTGIVSPYMGWASPTYGEKIPALACILEVSQRLPLELKSEWTLPGEA